MQTRSKPSSKIDDLKIKTETNQNEAFSCEKSMLNEPESNSIILSKDENRTKKRQRFNQIPPVESSAGKNIACIQTANDETNRNRDVQKNKSNNPPVSHQNDNNATVSGTSIQRRYLIFFH